VRWQTYQRRHEVENPTAFLSTMTTRLAINAAQTARARRETYIGPWLPEPVDTSADPLLGAERGEALEMAVLMLLEKLTPTERAAYVLREAFGYSYAEIGAVIEQSEASSRQLLSRARKHLASGKRIDVDAAEQRRLLDAFLAAAQAGDIAQLESLFAEDVVSYSDGGGAVRAAKVPVVGRERVAKFIHAFAGTFWGGVLVEPLTLNGQYAARASRDGRTIAVVGLHVGERGVDRVMWVMNPEKLARLPA
jgi:RNA polymerase sigma-70 factor (ECF subfamily)